VTAYSFAFVWFFPYLLLPIQDGLGAEMILLITRREEVVVVVSLSTIDITSYLVLAITIIVVGVSMVTSQLGISSKYYSFCLCLSKL